jgi:hypothetical protein
MVTVMVMVMVMVAAWCGQCERRAERSRRHRDLSPDVACFIQMAVSRIAGCSVRLFGRRGGVRHRDVFSRKSLAHGDVGSGRRMNGGDGGGDWREG